MLVKGGTDALLLLFCEWSDTEDAYLLTWCFPLCTSLCRVTAGVHLHTKQLDRCMCLCVSVRLRVSVCVVVESLIQTISFVWFLTSKSLIKHLGSRMHFVKNVLQNFSYSPCLLCSTGKQKPEKYKDCNCCELNKNSPKLKFWYRDSLSFLTNIQSWKGMKDVTQERWNIETNTFAWYIEVYCTFKSYGLNTFQELFQSLFK